MPHEVFVPGRPAPQGSKKHVGGGRMVEASKYLPAWRKALDEALTTSWQGKTTIEGPVIVEADFFLQKPVTTKHQICPTGPPDLDKLVRSVGDALTRARIVEDDSRITSWRVSKQWTTNEKKQGVRIRVH